MPANPAYIHNASAIAPAIERLLGDGEHLPNIIESDSNSTWPNGGGDHYGLVGGLAASLASHGPMKGTPLILPAIQSSPYYASYAPWTSDVPWDADELGSYGVYDTNPPTLGGGLTNSLDRQADTIPSRVSGELNYLMPGRAHYLGAAGPAPVIGRVWSPWATVKSGSSIANDNLEWRYWHETQTSSGGTFTPRIRRTDGTYEVDGSAVSTEAASKAPICSILRAPAETRTQDVSGMWGGNTADVVQPLMSLGVQCLSEDVSGGWTVEMLVGRAGATSDNYRLAALNMADASLQWYYQAITHKMQHPMVLNWVCFGINDSADPTTFSHEQFRRNLIVGLQRRLNQWIAAGLPENGFYVALVAPFSPGNVDDGTPGRKQWILDVAEDMRFVADVFPRTAAADTPQIATEAELAAAPYWDGGSNTPTASGGHHLIYPSGYDFLMGSVVDSVVDAVSSTPASTPILLTTSIADAEIANPLTETTITAAAGSRMRTGDIVQAEGSSELMLVESISGNDVTISRGYRGTTAQPLRNGQALRVLSADVAALTADIDGVTHAQLHELVLASLAGKTSLTTNGDGTKTLRFFKQDGTTALLDVTYNTDGEWTATEIDP